MTHVRSEVTAFIVMPAGFTASRHLVDPLLLISPATKLNSPAVQPAARYTLAVAPQWHPPPLDGNGLYEVAMTKLLGSGLGGRHGLRTARDARFAPKIKSYTTKNLSGQPMHFGC